MVSESVHHRTRAANYNKRISIWIESTEGRGEYTIIGATWDPRMGWIVRVLSFNEVWWCWGRGDEYGLSEECSLHGDQLVFDKFNNLWVSIQEGWWECQTDDSVERRWEAVYLYHPLLLHPPISVHDTNYHSAVHYLAPPVHIIPTLLLRLSTPQPFLTNNRDSAWSLGFSRQLKSLNYSN